MLRGAGGVPVFMPTALWGHFGIARPVRLSVPRRSCLGYRRAGCLQLSHRRPPEMCGLRTRPRTDVDPSRFFATVELPSAGAYRLAAPGAIPCFLFVVLFTDFLLSEFVVKEG